MLIIKKRLMEKLIQQAKVQMAEMEQNAQELDNGKKVAATRARKNAATLTKLCKEIRVKALEIQKSL